MLDCLFPSWPGWLSYGRVTSLGNRPMDSIHVGKVRICFKKKITLPWESNPGPTPIRGDLVTILLSVVLKEVLSFSGVISSFLYPLPFLSATSLVPLLLSSAHWCPFLLLSFTQLRVSSHPQLHWLRLVSFLVLYSCCSQLGSSFLLPGWVPPLLLTLFTVVNTPGSIPFRLLRLPLPSSPLLSLDSILVSAPSAILSYLTP